MAMLPAAGGRWVEWPELPNKAGHHFPVAQWFNPEVKPSSRWVEIAKSIFPEEHHTIFNPLERTSLPIPGCWLVMVLGPWNPHNPLRLASGVEVSKGTEIQAWVPWWHVLDPITNAPIPLGQDATPMWIAQAAEAARKYGSWCAAETAERERAQKEAIRQAAEAREKALTDELRQTYGEVIEQSQIAMQDEHGYTLDSDRVLSLQKKRELFPALEKARMDFQMNPSEKTEDAVRYLEHVTAPDAA